MLPTAGDLPAAPGWAYEVKWDGIRVISGVVGGHLHMETRNGNDIAPQFPELRQIIDVGQVILDGELVVLTHGRPDFGAVIGRLHARQAINARAQKSPAAVITFDVLRLRGKDLRSRPYEERRRILEGLELPAGWAVPPNSDDGSAIVAASMKLGLEGAIAKRLSSPYVSGRSRYWVKMRHRPSIDATIVGWTERESGGVTLLLAEETATGLAYAGRCPAPRDVLKRLAQLATRTPPITFPASRRVHWLRPELQVEVNAASRTPDGKLRHPQFVRLRLDQLGGKDDRNA
jgi:bifunctional non-homologous end joining protein LigD